MTRNIVPTIHSMEDEGTIIGVYVDIVDLLRMDLARHIQRFNWQPGHPLAVWVKVCSLFLSLCLYCTNPDWLRRLQTFLVPVGLWSKAHWILTHGKHNRGRHDDNPGGGRRHPGWRVAGANTWLGSSC